jgi:hypothetical protein
MAQAHKKVRGNAAHAQKFQAHKTARQMERFKDLNAQRSAIHQQLVGRSAMLPMPGVGCTHDSTRFRPVHLEPQRWRSRPEYAIVSVTHDGVTLSLASSAAMGGKLVYFNGDGVDAASFDFTQCPSEHGRGAVLNGAEEHALFTCGNNLLQRLINEADQEPGEFILPRLMIMTNCVKVDERKLDALAEAVAPELRAVYRKKLKEDAGVISLGQLFGRAELMPDSEIVDAFAENRAYEDFSELLGSPEINPARKVLAAVNPARDILAESGCQPGWEETATQDFVEKALSEMRARLPLHERATDSDLYAALLAPATKVQFSVPMENVPRSSIVQAMRSAMPFSAAIRHVVSDEELLAAAADPAGPMIVGRYGKTQVFRTADMKLPSYARGGFFAAPRSVTLELSQQ